MINYNRVKYACYSTNITMSVIANISPVLFLTFRELYGISYSQLGFLILINYVTQLSVDLVFSFFSHRFNIEKSVKITPLLALLGLLIYALVPVIFPSAAYFGLLIGTVIFSASGGFAEVLISPVIAAIPAKNTDREVSKLHSVYAWGVVGVIVFATAFLLIFGKELWWVLSLILTAVPLIASILFFGAALPKIETPERASGALKLLSNPVLWLSVIGIFLGGAAECTMAQWSSGYLERALGIPKVWGDIFGVAAFALMLGLGRTLYAKFGKRVEPVLLFGALGATACYLTAALVGVEIVGLIACAMTGFFTSMLWPGNLIVASDRVKGGGVFVFAIMAAGGDFGASVAPQLVGVITDTVMSSGFAADLSLNLGITAEQLGMKCGMLAGMIFPLLAIFVYFAMLKTKNRQNSQNTEYN